MDNTSDNSPANEKQLDENQIETYPVDNPHVFPSKSDNTIHKDLPKERKRTFTQTSDHTVVNVKDEKFNIEKYTQDLFTKETLYKKLPITDWLPKYDVSCAVSDAIAGITVGLTVIPQGIAYAGVANLPPKVINVLLISGLLGQK